MPNKRVFFLLVIAQMSVFLFQCSTEGPTDVAGGSTETENAMMRGRLVKQDGSPVAGGKISLINIDYDYETDHDSSYIITVTADQDGNYRFGVGSVKTGVYNLNAIDSVLDIGKFVANISITADSRINRGDDTLISAGKIIGKIIDAGSNDNSGTFVFIGGTPILCVTDVAGYFELRYVPEGTYTVSYIPLAGTYARGNVDHTAVLASDVTDIGTILLEKDTAGAPSRPEGVLASYDSSGDYVVISWIPNIEADVISYIIERKPNIALQPFVRIAESVQGNVFIDSSRTSLETDKEYIYRVIAVDDDEFESDPSKTCMVKIVRTPPSIAVSLPFFDDFNDGADDGWSKPEGGDWNISNGVYCKGTSSSDEDGHRISYVGDSSWHDYVVQVEAKTNYYTNGWYVLVFRVQDSANYYALQCHPDGGHVHLERRLDHGYTVLKDTSGFSFNPGYNYLRVALSGDTAKCYVNDQFIYSYTGIAILSGGAGLASWHVGSSFDNFLVTNDTAAVDSNVVAFWTFDEDSGDTLFDVSGNNLHGILNGAQRVTGQNGNAIQILQNPECVQIPYSPLLDLTEFKIEAFIKINDRDNFHSLLYKRVNNESVNYQLSVWDNGKLGAYFEDASDGDHFVFGNTLVPINEWTKVGFTYDGQTMRLYINDQLDGEQYVGLAPAVGNSQIVIGQHSVNTTESLRGCIDEVKISKY